MGVDHWKLVLSDFKVMVHFILHLFDKYFGIVKKTCSGPVPNREKRFCMFI